MEIPLVEKWREIYNPGQAKAYPVGPKDRAIIDPDCDKLHAQGRMEWTTTSTPFAFPYFVIWKMAEQGPKGRTVVDIRALNQITMPDAYPIRLQIEILGLLRDATYTSTIDLASFFYQWWVKKEHRYRLAVASHRGQETFKVPVMGFRHSLGYVQRLIDDILRPHRAFCRAYIDDIVISSASLEEHVEHLNLVFEALDEKNLQISAKKSYLGYPTAKLLGQRVEALGLATADEKLEAIAHLHFPRSLAQLEKYLSSPDT